MQQFPKPLELKPIIEEGHFLGHGQSLLYVLGAHLTIYIYYLIHSHSQTQGTGARGKGRIKMDGCKDGIGGEGWEIWGFGSLIGVGVVE